MARETDEWIGKTDDDAIPRRVQLRIWQKQAWGNPNGYAVCYLTGKPIAPGDDFQLDHVIPLILKAAGHRESNLKFCLTYAHRKKSAQEMAVRAESDARIASHHGLGNAESTGLEGRTKAEKHAAKHRRFLDSGKLPIPERRSMFAVELPAPIPLMLPDLRKERA